jgi:hypothetical protein
LSLKLTKTSTENAVEKSQQGIKAEKDAASRKTGSGHIRLSIITGIHRTIGPTVRVVINTASSATRASVSSHWQSAAAHSTSTATNIAIDHSSTALTHAFDRSLSTDEKAIEFAF